MSLNTDQHYIDKTLAGDTNAFSVLVNQYKHMVFTLAVRMLKNREEAEEVAQDVFLKAYQKLSNFQGEAKFSTWLYKIAYHRGLDALKKKKRTISTVAIAPEITLDVAYTDKIIDRLDAKARSSIIKNTINELKGDDAAVLLFFYFEELSMEEISAIMGISSNTVKVRLYRSRKRLGTLLQRKLESETLANYGRK